MEKLYRTFLEENITSEYLNEKFNYKFNLSNSKEEFLLEYKKFLGIYNSLFYNKNRFVTIINSYEIRISKKDIEHLFNLYNYTNINNMKLEKYILIDFLYTYYNTLITQEYKQNYSKSDEAIKDFISVLNEFEMQAYFFNNCVKVLYEFYDNLIDFAFENDIFIDGEIINRIFQNIKTQKEYYNKLVDKFILQKKNLYNIIMFDREKKKHIKIYFNYILDSLSSLGSYNHRKEMIKELDKKNCLNESMNNEIINKYIDMTNTIIENMKEKQYSFINGISEINILKNELNYLLKKITNINDKQKNKIRECLVQILRLKRYLISDDKYVKNEMQEFIYEEKISKENIEKIRQGLLENVLTIYSASKVNFIKEIENALDSYAKYPMQSLFPSFRIDSNKQIYIVKVGKKERIQEDNFKKFFDKKGEIYTKNHPNLMNKLYKDYYEELLKHLSTIFLMHQGFLISIIGKAVFYEIIEKLKEEFHYDYNNQYAIIVRNILSIEQNIANLMKNINLKCSDKGFYNINKLVDEYMDNEEILNGLMYLNYILYEKSGLNLRNNIMHGTLINGNLEIPLLVTFSGLIFVSWLCNR